MAGDSLARVIEALDRLPRRTRTVFLMHRLERRSYRDIAARHGISVGAVERLVATAVLALSSCCDPGARTAAD